MDWAEQFRVAAIVPCHNEEAAIAKVVRDLQHHLPGITVYVYDNCSTDRTAERAREAGAVVRVEPCIGKGNVVRRAFSDLDADIYLLVDGDDTYDLAAAPAMVGRLVEDNLDQVVGVRSEVRGADGASAYRPAHAAGNRILNQVVHALFGDTLGDMLSGYRVLSRRFVKSFPALSREFEIETELTVFSLALRIPTGSLQVGFRDRASGSESKLRTYRDGCKILALILSLARHERPIAFFGLVAALTCTLALAVAGRALAVHNGPGGPGSTSLVLTGFLVLAGILCMAAGVVLDGVRRTRHELARLGYMGLPAIAPAGAGTTHHRVVTIPGPVPEHPERPVYAFPAQRPNLSTRPG